MCYCKTISQQVKYQTFQAVSRRNRQIKCLFKDFTISQIKQEAYIPRVTNKQNPTYILRSAPYRNLELYIFEAIISFSILI